MSVSWMQQIALDREKSGAIILKIKEAIREYSGSIEWLNDLRVCDDPEWKDLYAKCAAIAMRHSYYDMVKTAHQIKKDNAAFRNISARDIILSTINIKDAVKGELLHAVFAYAQEHHIYPLAMQAREELSRCAEGVYQFKRITCMPFEEDILEKYDHDMYMELSKD